MGFGDFDDFDDEDYMFCYDEVWTGNEKVPFEKDPMKKFVEADKFASEVRSSMKIRQRDEYSKKSMGLLYGF